MIENEPGGERRACETWNPRSTQTKQLSAKGTAEIDIQSQNFQERN
jgi:hypothetical protein